MTDEKQEKKGEAPQAQAQPQAQASQGPYAELAESQRKMDKRLEEDLKRNNIRDAEVKDTSASTRVSPTVPGAKIPGQTVFPHGDPKAPPPENPQEAGERAKQSEAVRQKAVSEQDAFSTATPLDTGYPGHTTPAVHNPEDGKLHGQEHDRLESQRVMHEDEERVREQREASEAAAKNKETEAQRLRDGTQKDIAPQKNLETESPTKSPQGAPTATPPIGPTGPSKEPGTVTPRGK